MAIHETVDIQADGAAALLGEGPEQQAKTGEDDNQTQLFTLFVVLRAQVNTRQYRQANHRRDD